MLDPYEYMKSESIYYIAHIIIIYYFLLKSCHHVVKVSVPDYRERASLFVNVLRMSDFCKIKGD